MCKAAKYLQRLYAAGYWPATPNIKETHTTPQFLHEHLDWIIEKLRQIEKDINSLKRAARLNSTRMQKSMATLDDLVAAATDEDTKIDSLIALTTELKAKVDAIVSGSLTPEQQEKIDAAFAAISDNPDRIQAAIDANTDEEEPPVEEPPVEEPPAEEEPPVEPQF